MGWAAWIPRSPRKWAASSRIGIRKSPCREMDSRVALKPYPMDWDIMLLMVRNPLNHMVIS